MFEDRFVFKAAFRWGANNHTFLNIKDIAWSKLDESLALTCGSKLQKLLITQSEIKVELISARYHEKTINKVVFHPTDPKLFLTGSLGNLFSSFKNHYIFNFVHPNRRKNEINRFTS